MHLESLENTFVQALARGDTTSVITKRDIWDRIKSAIEARLGEDVERASTRMLDS